MSRISFFLFQSSISTLFSWNSLPDKSCSHSSKTTRKKDFRPAFYVLERKDRASFHSQKKNRETKRNATRRPRQARRDAACTQQEACKLVLLATPTRRPPLVRLVERRRIPKVAWNWSTWLAGGQKKVWAPTRVVWTPIWAAEGPGGPFVDWDSRMERHRHRWKPT